MQIQGHGAPSPQPVGTSGQLGKEQTLPCAEDLFSRYGVGLGQPDSATHRGEHPVSGHTETFSEAPGHPQYQLPHPLGLLHMRPLQHWLRGRVPRFSDY